MAANINPLFFCGGQTLAPAALVAQGPGIIPAGNAAAVTGPAHAIALFGKIQAAARLQGNKLAWYTMYHSQYDCIMNRFNASVVILVFAVFTPLAYSKTSVVVLSSYLSSSKRGQSQKHNAFSFSPLYFFYLTMYILMFVLYLR